MQSFYSRLRDICVEQRTSIYALEKATGASKGSFIKWRTSSPSVDILIKIADYLNVSLDYLVGREFPSKGD